VPDLAAVMTTDVVTVGRDEVIGPIRDRMLDGHLHAVPVVDDDGRPLGIVTSSDLVEEWGPGQGVATVMSTDVVGVTAATTLADAARHMLDRRIHHLLVIDDDGRVSGIVSSFDLLRHLAGRVEALSARLATGALKARPGDHLVVRPRQLGGKDRRGLITETRGEGGTSPFVVRWLDDDRDAEVLVFPGSDAHVE
jgi:CBS domain containing-hemolysin-like protein